MRERLPAMVVVVPVSSRAPSLRSGRAVVDATHFDATHFDATHFDATHFDASQRRRHLL